MSVSKSVNVQFDETAIQHTEYGRTWEAVGMKLLVCLHKGCANELEKWSSEKLEGGVNEIQCPDCGALHHAFMSSNDELYIQLVEDNG